MALAAYLQFHFPIREVRWEQSNGWRGSCFWYFDDSDDLADQVADFIGGAAQVDPKEYNDIVGRMKKQMFEMKAAQ